MAELVHDPNREARSVTPCPSQVKLNCFYGTTGANAWPADRFPQRAGTNSVNLVTGNSWSRSVGRSGWARSGGRSRATCPNSYRYQKLW